ncbi:hypothetical protein Nham_3472 [Nitrobacter hamburgensis X14]|uniref:Uncharacterized protein n=1 Tax=Nitrobacter hamburgensis (strain DSM 10229 / NCIMB 13809 / X14) TaxID=323097 RepID=Q1QHU6_NITHX|nr:hypothetical protein Nham_3472 [Nitrobacter hamburgensis X14]
MTVYWFRYGWPPFLSTSTLSTEGSDLTFASYLAVRRRRGRGRGRGRGRECRIQKLYLLAADSVGAGSPADFKAESSLASPGICFGIELTRTFLP